MLEALAAETRFSIKENDTGEPVLGGAPPWTCQAGLLTSGALSLSAALRLKASSCCRYSSVALGMTSKNRRLADFGDWNM